MNSGHLKNTKIITREHGYDLYDERFGKAKRQPFRETMDAALVGIIFACNYGRDYYLKRRKKSENDPKYKVSYLGSRYPFPKSVIESYDQKVFRIVSCSGIIPLKRVDYIVDALSLLAEAQCLKEIEWVHFGGGEHEELIKQYADSKLREYENVKYMFMGKTDNDLIHEYYSCNSVDCFITTSSTEGFPVSILEAMSYGIPIIATDVGGIKEVFVG